MIKIRLWDNNMKRYFPEYLIGELLLKQINTFNVEQYTGLKCGGGYDVYVGDILFDGYEYYVVEYDQERAGYTMRSKTVVDSLGNIDSEFMVKGNINENKELLE